MTTNNNTELQAAPTYIPDTVKKTVYRVEWKDDVPFIVVGKIVDVGKKRRLLKTKWRNSSDGNNQFPCHHSLKKAIDYNFHSLMVDYVFGTLNSSFSDEVLSNTLRKLNKLSRFKAKLKRRGLLK